MTDSQPTATPERVSPTKLRIERGTCYALFAYDVGFSIDLDEAQRRITSMKQRESIHHKRRTPPYFDYQPAPLRVTQSIEPVQVGRHTTTATVDSVIYDFGAVSVMYSIPLKGSLSDLLALSHELWDHPQLWTVSRRVVEELSRAISPAISKLEISALVEDYSIYEIDEFAPQGNIEQAISDHAPLLAQILRAEETQLSRQEISDTLAWQLSFGPDDRAIIDWNAALLFDRESDDVRAVLEFANVELLEMRYLDDCLDNALDQAYDTMPKQSRWRYIMPGSKATDLARVAQLQMDGALLFEAVNNALKLIGDQYLARVYRITSQRFHLSDWDASILRKLQTLESIYEKISDRQANRRIEVLEWIIIILIAVEIVLMLIPGLFVH